MLTLLLLNTLRFQHENRAGASPQNPRNFVFSVPRCLGGESFVFRFSTGRTGILRENETLGKSIADNCSPVGFLMSPEWIAICRYLCQDLHPSVNIRSMFPGFKFRAKGVLNVDQAIADAGG